LRIDMATASPCAQPSSLNPIRKAVSRMAAFDPKQT
jgi:hypothetical protein